MNYEAGMLAWSRAGHDKDTLYVIVKTEGEYVYLSDGRLKPVDHPKKKKIRHIQIVRQIPEELLGLNIVTIKNEEIRKAIRRFSNV
ncbi:KOW domain-containing RNA-binding protein [Jingyaoa shaoxingensis]|uniref:KOW domain-containing RNA-binding protein n=1 Tax=Jingyaoa shaoxingensis TaxID=2763671 RepID=A0ABR7N5P9_9FIRM|nr:KOW domain-containing RNA-binding protein [Jingyaoa shaoxingensis]MBC8571729.1 KOW domain-containing RNA-binding protein [Jingyaoa shaoxingensis]